MLGYRSHARPCNAVGRTRGDWVRWHAALTSRRWRSARSSSPHARRRPWTCVAVPAEVAMLERWGPGGSCETLGETFDGPPAGRSSRRVVVAGGYHAEPDEPAIRGCPRDDSSQALYLRSFRRSRGSPSSDQDVDDRIELSPMRRGQRPSMSRGFERAALGCPPRTLLPLGGSRTESRRSRRGRPWRGGFGRSPRGCRCTTSRER